MANTQTWTYGLIIYFIGLIAIVTLFGIANSFSSNEVTTTGISDMYADLDQTTNQSQGYASSGNVDWGDTFKFIFSFFAWNLYVNEGVTLMQYLWLVRLFLVWLPFLALIVTLYYSAPFTGGH